ncbi:MAG: ABC transporter ATP-binding protein [Treponema sp.]
MIILEVDNVSKYYGSKRRPVTGCEHISFTAETGGIYSLLGLNGAGKSTVLNIIAGYRRPSSGEVQVCGYSMSKEPIEAKQHIGILYEQNPLYNAMTVQDFLLFTLHMRGIPARRVAAALEEVLEFTDLQEVYRKPIKTLSKGYRQRVGLAQAIIHRPQLILLDEPVSGLDALQTADFEKKILTLSLQSAVILCTHQLDIAERLCSRHILLHKGNIIAQGSRQELAETLSQDCGMEILSNTPSLLLSAFEFYAGIEKAAFTASSQPRTSYRKNTVKD